MERELLLIFFGGIVGYTGAIVDATLSKILKNNSFLSSVILGFVSSVAMCITAIILVKLI